MDELLSHEKKRAANGHVKKDRDTLAIVQID
jgi:hypothetical protein